MHLEVAQENQEGSQVAVTLVALVQDFLVEALRIWRSDEDLQLEEVELQVEHAEVAELGEEEVVLWVVALGAVAQQ